MGSMTEDVMAILGRFRREHDWQPGMVWDAERAKYVWPDEKASTLTY